MMDVMRFLIKLLITEICDTKMNFRSFSRVFYFAGAVCPESRAEVEWRSETRGLACSLSLAYNLQVEKKIPVL